MDHVDPDAAARMVLALLEAAGKRLVTAESCTGGMICAALTDIPGASNALEGGFVTYSNALKHAALGVARETLDWFGAVSMETARAMAEGALAHARDADIAVSVTGVAGPDGGTAEKPVGTVWFGLALRGRETHTERRVFPGDRAEIRGATVLHALGMVLDALSADA